MHIYPTSLRLLRHRARLISLGAAAMWAPFLRNFRYFWRILEVFGQFWGVMQVFTDFCRFWRFLVDFGRVLGAHVGGILEAKTDENWKKCVFCYIF